MKKISISLVLLLAVVIISGCQKEEQAQDAQTTPEVKSISVGVQTAEQSKSLASQNIFPANVVADQEISVAAKTSGTAVSVNYKLGDKVNVGSVLARIDDTGTNLGLGKDDFRSSQIQSLELAVKQAKESLDLAKKNYKADKNNQTKSAKDLAEIQYESAQVSLKAALDSHVILSPIAGTITKKEVAVGDSVNLGQELFTVSKTDKTKVQFFVDQAQAFDLSVGYLVAIKDSNNKLYNAKIINVSAQADQASRKFLVEALPTDKVTLAAGIIVDVIVDGKATVDNENLLILPLSSIAVGQNEKYVFVVESGMAKKVAINILKIEGETAQVEGDLLANDQIIVKGNKLVKEGDKIVISE